MGNHDIYILNNQLATLTIRSNSTPVGETNADEWEIDEKSSPVQKSRLETQFIPLLVTLDAPISTSFISTSEMSQNYI